MLPMSMNGYTKLFNSILASTIWRADDKTRLVWITMLAMADKHGRVEGSVPGLADFARVSIPDCQRALGELSGPDEYSRSKEHDGRRIEVVDGGWRLINHGKYRDKMNADERREYFRIKQQEHRDKVKRSQQTSTTSKTRSVESTESTHTYSDTEATTEKNTTRTADASVKQMSTPSTPSQTRTARVQTDDENADILATAIETFRSVWKDRYGFEPALFTSAVHLAKFGEALRRMGVETFTIAIRGFIADNDPYIVKSKHSLRLFLAEPSRYVPTETAPIEESPHTRWMKERHLE